LTTTNPTGGTPTNLLSISRQWISGALIFFLLASLLGAVMRLFWIEEIPFLDYKHILHAHSHTALLGWGYILISGLLIYLYIPVSPGNNIIKRIWYGIVIATAGMFIAFIYQGYGAVSIAFSVLFVFISYAFAWYFFKFRRPARSAAYETFFRWAVIWQLISTMGLWAIPVVSITMGKAHPLYHMSVQFFLHFQFNGWFSYAVIGLVVYYLNKQGYNLKMPKYTFAILQLSLLLTYAQSITWSNPLQTIFYFNSLGVLLQATAFFLIFSNLWKSRPSFGQHTSWMKGLLFLGIGSLLFKVLIQSMVVVPQIATISYTIRNFVIGFIHIIMLGAVTMTGGFMISEFNLIKNNKLTRLGWVVLMIGFVLTEFILFGQGILLWMREGYVNNYYQLIFGATILLPVAISLLTIGNRRNMKPIITK
jgi:hypothetical protein